MFKKIIFGCIVFTCSFMVSAEAIHNQEKAQAFTKLMVEKHGFEREYIEALINGAERKQSIIDAISRPAEKILTWKDYRKIFITDRRIKQGREFLQQYDADLTRAETTYGVPKALITSIIGVETFYGRNKGSYRVIDSLATLAFDYPPRSKFFSGELEAYLLLVKEQGFDATQVKGSYAGAMGYGQFISSSYRHYAVDFDGDGIVDIVNNPIDAIGSVANYFKMHGWKTGMPVTATAVLDSNTNRQIASKKLKPKLTVAQLEAEGFRSSVKLEQSQKATAMILSGEAGDEAWIGLKNFYVITRYNHSKLYAMAVYQLSQAF